MYDDKAYHKAYYQANREKIIARSKARREAHKEELSDYGKEWRRKNPEYYKRYNMSDLVKG